MICVRSRRLLHDRSTEIYGCVEGGPVGCPDGGPFRCADGGPFGWVEGGPVGCPEGGPFRCADGGRVGCVEGGPVGCAEGEAPGCGTAAQNAATLPAPPAAFTRLRKATAFWAAVPCAVACLKAVHSPNAALLLAFGPTGVALPAGCAAAGWPWWAATLTAPGLRPTIRATASVSSPATPRSKITSACSGGSRTASRNA